MSLSSLSLFVILTSAFTIVLFHLLILKEEKHLEDIHGESYRKYKMDVGRYI